MIQPLDVASAGKTPEEARQAVDEAVRLFLATAAEHGTLEEVLEDAGYCREGGSWRGPDWPASSPRAQSLGRHSWPGRSDLGRR